MSKFSDNSEGDDGGSGRFDSSKGFGWEFVRFVRVSKFSDNLVSYCAELGRFETSSDFEWELSRLVRGSEFSDNFIVGPIDSECLPLQVASRAATQKRAL